MPFIKIDKRQNRHKKIAHIPLFPTTPNCVSKYAVSKQYDVHPYKAQCKIKQRYALLY